MMKPKFFMPFFLLSLITGTIGGWYRMGWDIYIPHTAASHGLLMVGGFMGGVITLERMITMKQKWWLIFPGVAALSVIVGLLGYSQAMILCQSMASMGMTLFYFHHLRNDQSGFWYILLLGALSWFIGNINFLITNTIPLSLPWWIGFILFTILGERLELTRFLPVSKAKLKVLYVLLGVSFISLALPLHGVGHWLYICSLGGLIAWFSLNDMARKSIKKPGYSRYLGTGILTGYGWLAIHLLAFLFFKDQPLGYDLFIHTFFLGFGFSMIWAHAPMILPAVLKLPNRPYHPVLWIMWSIFQVSLLARILVSVMEWESLRRILGMINGLSIFLMFGTLITLMKLFASSKK